MDLSCRPCHHYLSTNSYKVLSIKSRVLASITNRHKSLFLASLTHIVPRKIVRRSVLGHGTRPRYNLVVDEDVKKPNKPNQTHIVPFFFFFFFFGGGEGDKICFPSLCIFSDASLSSVLFDDSF